MSGKVLSHTVALLVGYTYGDELGLNVVAPKIRVVMSALYTRVKSEIEKLDSK